jgi:hypothetical protein
MSNLPQNMTQKTGKYEPFTTIGAAFEGGQMVK